MLVLNKWDLCRDLVVISYLRSFLKIAHWLLSQVEVIIFFVFYLVYIVIYFSEGKMKSQGLVLYNFFYLIGLLHICMKILVKLKLKIKM